MWCFCPQNDDVGELQVYSHSALDGIPSDLASAGDQNRLNLPKDFCMRCVDSASATSMSSSGYVSLNDEQKTKEMNKLQSMIREFVVEFLQGVYLDAVLENGSLVPCRCTMDSKLQVLILQVHQTTKTLDLASIQEICSGRELHDLRVTTPLDEFCVTLVMADDQCVSFKFGDEAGREHFTTCMKVLRLAID
mmetsp:Transcript_26705/g.69795  ORF Transcript_26705/g.69795 Transcript_26705/m.69795 type:complete len:192 (-) Transcript_26705:212-787(-)